MTCAVCYHLAGEGQDVREAVTVVAGYAACGPHVELAEAAGSVDVRYGSLGLSGLEGEAGRNCGQCGRFLGSDLARLEGPDSQPMCIACVAGGSG
jgi:hypothetical protein